jgi:methionyl aminopeptidase
MSGTQLKSPAEIEIMDRANRIIREILVDLRESVRPGVTTLELDRFAEERIREAGGVPAFKGYPHRKDGNDFPATICASVNDEVVHGIPSDRVVLKEGDIVSVDLGIQFQGYYGDAAETFAVGAIGEDASRLLRATRQALELGVEQARPGNRVSDIGHAVQLHVEREGFSVVRHFVGHGIGASLHEEPQVPNFGLPGRGPRLAPGMVLAIEPMVNAGSPDVILDAHDGWTARTRDGSLSAHFEWSVAVTEDGPKVLGDPLPVTAAR